MIANILMFFKFILLVGTVLTSYALGWYFTEKFDLASKSSLFRFKSFECRKCLSFHLNWVLSTCISILFGDWIMFVIGILFSALLFTGLMIDEKEKTIKL